MKFSLATLVTFISCLLSTGFADAEQIEVETLVLSPDSLLVEDVAESAATPINTSVAPIYNKEVTISSVKHSNSSVSNEQKEIHVLLVPGGVINSSFSKTVDPIVVQQLRNAINATQLQFKNEDAYVPVSTSQTIDRIQSYLAQAVHGQLSECGVPNMVNGEELTEINKALTPPESDFLYKIDLGVNRLVINRSLLSAKLSGEAEATVLQNRNISKKISVNSYAFADKEMLLEHQQSDGLERDVELKKISSRVVDRLAERLGKKLCQYFN